MSEKIGLKLDGVGLLAEDVLNTLKLHCKLNKNGVIKNAIAIRYISKKLRNVFYGVNFLREE